MVTPILTLATLSGSANWEVPYFKNDSNAFLKHALGGWALTGIVNLRSGQPFSIFDCTNAAFEVCTRLIPTGSIAFKVNNNPPGTSQPNEFTLIDLSSQTPGNYSNPKVDLPGFDP